jgi:hypothetical protein
MSSSSFNSPQQGDSETEREMEMAKQANHSNSHGSDAVEVTVIAEDEQQLVDSNRHNDHNNSNHS